MDRYNLIPDSRHYFITFTECTIQLLGPDFLLIIIASPRAIVGSIVSSSYDPFSFVLSCDQSFSLLKPVTMTPANGDGANGYGTGTNSTPANGFVDENAPLLGGASAKTSSWRKRMTADVHRDWADLILMLCYTITGMLDSASISTWGSFVSMQTGNLPFPLSIFATSAYVIQATRCTLDLG